MWRMVAHGVEAEGADAASVAVARAATSEGIYRVSAVRGDRARMVFRIPAYGVPVRITG